MRLARVLLQKARRSRGPDLHGLRLQGFSATHGGGFFRGCTARYDEMPKPGLRAALAHSFQAAAPGSIHDAAAGPIVGISHKTAGAERDLCFHTDGSRSAATLAGLHESGGVEGCGVFLAGVVLAASRRWRAARGRSARRASPWTLPCVCWTWCWRACGCARVRGLPLCAALV